MKLKEKISWLMGPTPVSTKHIGGHFAVPVQTDNRWLEKGSRDSYGRLLPAVSSQSRSVLLQSQRQAYLLGSWKILHYLF
jgi:hypothetical protein